MSIRISRKSFAAAAIVFASLVLLLAAAPRAHAEVKRFPAAGTVLWSAVAARKSPSPRARVVTRLHQMRVDGRPQIVHAIGKRRVGAVSAATASLTLRSAAGANAVRFAAKVSGADGNVYRVTIRDHAPNPAQDEFLLSDGGTPLITLQYADASVASLVAQVNTYSLPITATLLADGAPLAPAAGRPLAGGRDAKEGTLWYRLNLPIRPFGQKGWVPAETVSVRHVATQIIVHRRAKFLEVRRNGRRIFRAPVATGRADRPTPLGYFYVAAKYRPPINALVSAYALELSAPAGLPDFLKGGVVGIHGTPATHTIGKNASNGCIRVHNRTVMRLKALVPLGAPVKVVR